MPGHTGVGMQVHLGRRDLRAQGGWSAGAQRDQDAVRVLW